MSTNLTLPPAERDPLYRRICAFAIDEGPAAHGFADRLADENGWPRRYTARVIAEYRKFLYLCATAGVPMTPSDQVDQAWHLHLTHTRSYWQRLCREVLPAPLHHEPTLGGCHERAKFHAWYERTLDAYRRAFGSEPPADVWPPARIRFGVDAHARRVHTRRCWVIPRPGRWLSRYRARIAVAVLLLAGCLLFLGCDSRQKAMAFVAGFYLIVLGVPALFIYWKVRSWLAAPAPAARARHQQTSDGGSCGGSSGDCDGGGDGGDGGDGGCGGGCGGCGCG